MVESDGIGEFVDVGDGVAVGVDEGVTVDEGCGVIRLIELLKAAIIPALSSI